MPMKVYTLICVDCKSLFEVKKRVKSKDKKYRCRNCKRKIADRKHRTTAKRREYMRRYMQNRKENNKHNSKKWREINKEYDKERKREYYQTEKGREVSRRANKKRYWLDPESFRIKKKARKCEVSVPELLQLEQKCQLCRKTDNLEVDHMHPVSKGGKGTIGNLQMLCQSCNRFKGNRLILPGGGILIDA